MIKLLIIADDFTGALDTAVQFAACGAKTRVVTDSGYNLKKMDESVEVLVLNAETRHLHAEKAYKVVYDIVRQAAMCDIPYIYKKTDSALRGNIGSELTAVLDAARGRELHFIPALPKMNRITEDGIHYINGVPVHQSVFGKDPFEPVTKSSVSDLIAEQSQIRVTEVSKMGGQEQTHEPVIVVYDVRTDEELVKIAENLYRKGQLYLMSGCAGLAAVLPRVLHLEGDRRQRPEYRNGFLVVCGSVNPITRSQLDYAQMQGFYRICLTPEQKLSDHYFDTSEGKHVLESWRNICINEKRCILDTNDLPGNESTLDYAREHSMTLEEVRLRISATLGRIVKMFLMWGVDSTIMLTGGDTLLGFMEQMQCKELTPVCELAPGTVFSFLQIDGINYPIVTKSGGFGEENLLVTLSDIILKK